MAGSGLSVNKVSRGYICCSWFDGRAREKPGSFTLKASRPLPQALREIYDGQELLWPPRV